MNNGVKIHALKEGAVRYKYINQRKPLRLVAHELGCSIMTLWRFCKKKNIPSHKLRELTLNLKNVHFGFLKALEITDKRTPQGSRIWKCRCGFNNCGNIIERSSSQLMHGRKTNQSCGCYIKSSNFLGHEDLSMSYFSSVRRGAESRKYAFEIDIKYIWNIFVKQNRKCALSGVDISLQTSYRRGGRLAQTASLDRIDSSKGYIKGNVQWIYKKLQFLKSNLPDEEFIEWCRKITKHSKDRKF